MWNAIKGDPLFKRKILILDIHVFHDFTSLVALLCGVPLNIALKTNFCLPTKNSQISSFLNCRQLFFCKFQQFVDEGKYFIRGTTIDSHPPFMSDFYVYELIHCGMI